jgi:hypothetical protein
MIIIFWMFSVQGGVCWNKSLFSFNIKAVIFAAFYDDLFVLGYLIWRFRVLGQMVLQVIILFLFIFISKKFPSICMLLHTVHVPAFHGAASLSHGHTVHVSSTCIPLKKVHPYWRIWGEHFFSRQKPYVTEIYKVLRGRNQRYSYTSSSTWNGLQND